MLRSLWRFVWRWLGMVRKVLVEDDGTGHQAYVDEAPTVHLTGGVSSTGHFFRGPDDPADTPAFLALLLPGDLWVDTTGGVPYQHKERNAANDDWEYASMVAKDAEGVVTTSVIIGGAGGLQVLIGEEGVDGTLTFTAFVATLQVGTTSVMVGEGGGGSVSHLGSPTAAIDIGTDGSILIIGASGGIEIAADGTTTLPSALLTSLPTSNPGAGLLWNDGGTVKVGT